MLTLFNKQNTEYFSILDWYFKKFIIPDVSITQGKSHWGAAGEKWIYTIFLQHNLAVFFKWLKKCYSVWSSNTTS